MQIRTSNADGFRISVSNTPSCSNHTSGYDDIESLGDVFLWGELWSDVGSTDNTLPSKTDVTVPRLLESNVVIDVHQIACGVRHFSLVTKQGELFTWGEESGGRLGHGLDQDFGRPRLVEFLAVTNVEYVACGEFHTCAISTSGDLYTWGDGSHNAGLLGHGTDASHWIPKRVSGPLEGLVVCSVACSTWHTALATIDGRLFTFGDGTFGVLGHGDRVSVKYPLEVQSLNGLKALKVACGVWHTAAIVEITNQHGGLSTSRKLFTWGDGEKHRLGHGNKDTYLKPTCISALIDYNFHQLACGNTMTLALTTSGHVFSFGSTSYGQLGNPQSDGKLPALVQDGLVGEFVEEIACGAYHVAVLTSRSEIFTWGMGANGRLGHGDYEDRKTPTLVELLKDRVVKSISCGASFTASICIHKWMPGADQSVCSGCKQAFGFTRKRHNCYNCGFVHCHACSSRKALKAAQAPIPGKPHRVCDSCYAKLIKKTPDIGMASGNTSSYYRRFSNQMSQDVSRKVGSGPSPARTSRLLMSPNIEPAKYLEIMSAMYGPKSGSYSSVRTSQVPSSQQLKDITFPSSIGSAFRLAATSSFQMQSLFLPAQQLPPQPQPPPLPASSRPGSRRLTTPSCSGSPMFSRGVIDNLSKSNELLNQQVKSLKRSTERQDAEIHKLQTYAEESASLASERNSKCQVAVDILRFVKSKLKTLTEKLPPDISEDETIKSLTFKVDDFLQSPSRKNSRRRQSRSEESDNESCVGEETKEVVEQCEPGVYVTLVEFPNGIRKFKRVKFSKRKFGAEQAEEWWKENKERVLMKYNSRSRSYRGASTSAAQAPPDQDPSTST
ncbi:PH, RCC1 and FYVE domains-containing protein 1-like isoform X2 [Bidens hawaiensis]|uniref:PH, RCC1 and FYVE domains-containing protein 1-like isoform X2 n=1 Tax=Bidens hawaiensis TaxID=980011 RepID=UPI00404B514B